MAFGEIDYNMRVVHLNNEYTVKKELLNIKADKKAHELLVQKMIFLHIKLEQVDTRAANMLKQHIHAMGGEAAISKEAYAFTERTTDMLLSASRETFRLLAKRIINLPYGLNKISKEIERCLFSNHGVMEFSDKVFDFREKTYIMGILDLSKNFQLSNYSDELISKKIDSMIKAGVDIIEIYGDDNSDFDEYGTEQEKNRSFITYYREYKKPLSQYYFVY